MQARMQASTSKQASKRKASMPLPLVVDLRKFVSCRGGEGPSAMEAALAATFDL
jgi:hypothetical protein